MNKANIIPLLVLCTLHGSLFSTSKKVVLTLLARQCSTKAPTVQNLFPEPLKIRMSFLYTEEQTETTAETTALALVESKALVCVQPVQETAKETTHRKLDLSYPRLCCLLSK